MRRVRCYWVSLTVVCAGMCVCVRECECAKLWVWVLSLSAKHFRGSLVNNEHNLACIFLRVNRNWISLYRNDPSWSYTASLYWLRMKITLSSSAAVMKKWHVRAVRASVKGCWMVLIHILLCWVVGFMQSPFLFILLLLLCDLRCKLFS